MEKGNEILVILVIVVYWKSINLMGLYWWRRTFRVFSCFIAECKYGVEIYIYARQRCSAQIKSNKSEKHFAIVTIKRAHR
jgi:hypothetical protein